MDKLITISLQVYLALAGFIFTPYFNWQYAKEHGFVSWLFFGEIVPTLKALFWPFFLN
jgi:hypothetical protein